MESKHSRRAASGRVAAALSACLVVLGCFAANAAAKPLAHGDFIHITKHANANQSNNWFGYNQGTLEKSNTLFHSITGDWTVPHRHPARLRSAASSSDWIGIGARLHRRRLHGRRQHADPDRYPGRDRRSARIVTRARDDPPSHPPPPITISTSRSSGGTCMLSPTVQPASMRPPPMPIQSDDDRPDRRRAGGGGHGPVAGDRWNSVFDFSSVPWL